MDTRSRLFVPLALCAVLFVVAIVGIVFAPKTDTIPDYTPSVALRSSSPSISSALSSKSTSSTVALPGEFHSSYFTLSFELPEGFEVRESQNSIAIYKPPYKSREIGDSNAFLMLKRYVQNTKAAQSGLYRKLLKEPSETTVTVDGLPFPMIRGGDFGRFGGGSDNAGRVTAVFFDGSWLEIIERPMNETQDFDPIATGEQILSTFRFSKE